MGTVSAKDTVAGLGTTITVSGIQANTETNVIVAPPYGPEIVLSATAGSNGSSSVRLEGSDTELAGNYAIVVEGGAGTTLAKGTLIVHPDTVDAGNSSIRIDRATIAIGEEAIVSVMLRDRFGNPLDGRPVELIPSRASDRVAPLTRETDERGQQEFALRATEPGVVSLRALDLLAARLLDAQAEVIVESFAGRGGTTYAAYPATTGYNSYNTAPASYGGTQLYGARPTNTYGSSNLMGSVAGRPLYGQVGSFDVVDHFQINVPDQVKVFDTMNIEIIAMDRQNRIVEGYTGTVFLFSTDPEALLPLDGEIAFRPQDLGVKVLRLGLQFQTPGQLNKMGQPTHVLHVEDNRDPSISGETELIVMSITTGGGTQRPLITITSPKLDSTVNSLNIMVEGVGPPFVNLEVLGGEEDAFGDSDQSGAFSIPLKLNATQTDHTLRVRDASGRYDSGNIRIRLDATAPTLGEILFNPATPEEGKEVSISVQSEPGLPSVQLTVGGSAVMLKAGTAAQSGSYVGTFTAPAAGQQQLALKATDSAGNAEEIRVSLTTLKKALPTVTGVSAEAKANAITLQWASVEDDTLKHYRIYVGDQPGEFLYTLDTDRPTTAATVAGLRAGTSYIFAVTAVDGDRESAKSQEVEATVLGLKLEVSPQDSSLLIEWSSLQTDMPLSSFILEYGVSSDDLTETRTLNGELRAFTLRDLLNDVTYYMRLTPVTTTGNKLGELAADGVGTPSAVAPGFTPTPADPIPFNPSTDRSRKPGAPLPPISKHHNVPEIPSTGIPPLAWWLAGGVSTLLLMMHMHRRRTLRMTLQFFEDMEKMYKG